MNAKRLFSAVGISLAASILPLPDWLIAFRPAWILLLILYIQFHVSNQYHIFLVLFLGICLDVLMASIIGEHAFSLLISTWVASIFLRRFSFYPTSQQIFIIFIVTVIYQLSLNLMDEFLGGRVYWVTVFGVPLVSGLLWPWVCILLRHHAQRNNQTNKHHFFNHL